MHLDREPLQVRIDVLCLQEHKLKVGRLSRIYNEVCSGAHWLCALAAEGIHALRNPEVEASEGGGALGINLELAHYISH